MAKKRKKTLLELIEDGMTGSDNNSAYTSEPMKQRKNTIQSTETLVNNLYKRKNTQTTTENSTWRNVVARANQLYQNTSNSRSGVTQQNGNALINSVKSTQTKPITEIKDGKKVDKAEIKYEAEKIKKEKEQKERLENIPEENILAKSITTVGNLLQDVTQKPKELYDGYQPFDLLKIVSSTAAGAGSHVVGGVEQVGNALAQGFGYGMATANKILGKEETAEKWIKATQEQQEERETTRNKIFNVFDKNSVLGETANQVAEAYGQSLSLGTVGKANKTAGDLLTFAQGAGSGFQEAYSEEDVKAWQAILKASGGGLISYISENTFDNLGYGGTKLTDSIKNKITKDIETGVGKALARVGFTATGESLEEITEIYGNAFVNRINNALADVLGEGAKYDDSVKIEEVVENAAMGFFSGGFSEGSSTFVQNSIQSNQVIKDLEKQTGKKLTSEQKQQIKEEQLYNSETQKENETIIDNSDLSDTLKSKIKEISQKNNLSNADVESLIKKVNEAKKQLATIENKEVLNQSQQTTLEQGGEAEKAISKQPMGNEKYSIKMPNSNYKFEKTGDINSDNLDESMSKYFNNSEATQKLNSTLKNIMKDKNLSIKFDDSITDEQGNILDGKYENGSITINPNSTRAFEYIATHELTHAIGTEEMLNMVQNYRESNSEFNTKVETLLKNYDKTELTEEALADVSAQLFGTQEFINDVKNKNPNLFQKIYNEIKYLWHQFRGYKNEKQFIEDLYNKWTAAYNSKEELNQTTKNMIVGENALTIDVDSKKSAEERLNKGENKYLVFAETGWFRNKDGKMKTEIDDSKSKIILEKTRSEVLNEDTIKLSEILKHDKLYKAYPELKDINVIFEKNPSYNGNYNPNTNEIRIDIEQYMDDETYNQILDSMLKRLREADSKNMLFIYDNDMDKINEIKRRNKKRNS